MHLFERKRDTIIDYLKVLKNLASCTFDHHKAAYRFRTALLSIDIAPTIAVEFEQKLILTFDFPTARRNLLTEGLQTLAHCDFLHIRSSDLDQAHTFLAHSLASDLRVNMPPTLHNGTNTVGTQPAALTLPIEKRPPADTATGVADGLQGGEPVMDPAVGSDAARPTTTTIPFSVDFVAVRLPGGLSSWEWASVPSESKLYAMILSWGATSIHSHSVTLSTQEASKKDTREEMIADLESTAGRPPTTTEVLGLGWHGPYTHDSDGVASEIYVLHHRVGEPVGTNCGPKVMTELVLFSRPPPRGERSVVAKLCDDLLCSETTQVTGQFKIFRWMSRHCYWRKDTTCLARSLDTVVLPSTIKDRLLEDVRDFISIETLRWFVEHGIPYKRSYLFWGPPGTGKTSMIQALAGDISRNICYLSPSDPNMTDDSLKSAVQDAPKNSIIVLEDVDALFGQNRAKSASTTKSAITFSGVLNALDGVGMPMGQIFILTTNHRERLDPALIRSGRVDMHVEFSSASTKQMRDMFVTFYPGEEAAADAFVSRLTEALDEETELAMSSLQSFFIRNRKSTASEAADNVAMIIKDLEDRKFTEAEVQRQREDSNADKVAAKSKN